MFGVVGRPSASVAGYNYSDAMKAANKTWDEATLNVYLTDPKAAVPGNKMAFAGLPNPEDRAQCDRLSRNSQIARETARARLKRATLIHSATR